MLNNLDVYQYTDNNNNNNNTRKLKSEESYASCEVNGKKSQFTHLRGGLNIRQIFQNFDTWSKITRTLSPLNQIGF